MTWCAAAAVSPESTTKVSAALTNEVSIDDLVAEILMDNPELGFYRAEIAAARGERQRFFIRPWLNADGGLFP